MRFAEGTAAAAAAAAHGHSLEAAASSERPMWRCCLRGPRSTDCFRRPVLALYVCHGIVSVARLCACMRLCVCARAVSCSCCVFRCVARPVVCRALLPLRVREAQEFIPVGRSIT